jgi:hypothetical protein
MRRVDGRVVERFGDLGVVIAFRRERCWRVADGIEEEFYGCVCVLGLRQGKDMPCTEQNPRLTLSSPKS